MRRCRTDRFGTALVLLRRGQDGVSGWSPVEVRFIGEAGLSLWQPSPAGRCGCPETPPGKTCRRGLETESLYIYYCHIEVYRGDAFEESQAVPVLKENGGNK